MKNIFLITIMLFSVNSFAKSSDTINLSEYTLLKSETHTNEYPAYKDRHSREYLEYKEYEDFPSNDPKAVSLVCLKILSKNKLTATKEVSESDCSDILIKNTITNSRKYHHAYGPNYYEYKVRVLTETYCKPRSYSDMALMSLFKKCQESPQQDCFNPQLISQLNQVKRTTVTEFNSGDCNF